MVGSAGLRRLEQLAPKRPVFVRGRMDGEVVIGRIIDNVQYLAPRTMDATPRLFVFSIEVLVVEEIEPMRAVVPARGSMQMERRHNTLKAVPSKVVAGRLSVRIEIESSHAPPAMVSAITELIAGQENGKVAVTVLVYWLGVLCHGRGWWGQNEDRRGEGQARSRPPHFPDA